MILRGKHKVLQAKHKMIGPSHKVEMLRWDTVRTCSTIFRTRNASSMIIAKVWDEVVNSTMCLWQKRGRRMVPEA